MAVTYVGNTFASGVGTTPSVTRSCTAGNLVVVYVVANSLTNTLLASAIPTGADYTVQERGWGADQNLCAVALVPATGGSQVFSFTLIASADVWEIYAIEYSGVTVGNYVAHIDIGTDATSDTTIIWNDTPADGGFDGGYEYGMVFGFLQTVTDDGSTSTVGTPSGFTKRVDNSTLESGPIYHNYYLFEKALTSPSAGTGDISIGNVTASKNVKDINIVIGIETSVLAPTGMFLGFSF